MNKFFCIMFMNDLSKGNHFLCYYVTVLAAAAGNHQPAGLLAALYGMEDNIFLQHTVVAECCSA